MKNSILSSLIFAALIFSSGILFAQNPTTIVCQGTLTDINGNSIASENCIVRFSIENTDDEQLFTMETTETTNETGVFTLIVENLPEVFSTNTEKELVNIELLIKSSEGSTWHEDDKFNVIYHLEKKGANDFTLTRHEGQKLVLSVINPVWVFSDVYPIAYLSSKFLISFSKDMTDPESIIQISKKSHLEVEPAQAAPLKRGLKGGYAVGGYKK
jgi:hypothetical protein